MGLDFRSQVFEGMALLPSYTSWLLTCDMEPVYRYHKRVLQLLQWRCPPTRWWLKTPSHMASIDALDAVYPDARFVMTHRDIGQVIPSVCALKRALGSPVSEDLNLFALGSHETALWSESLRRLIEFRDGGREDRFFDVAFEELQRDPIGAIERLYAALDEDLEDETRKQMIEWWQESSKDRQPGHRPDPADFGLNVALLRHDFAFYHDRFGITAG
jgi:Sulfotransferase family